MNIKYRIKDKVNKSIYLLLVLGISALLLPGCVSDGNRKDRAIQSSTYPSATPAVTAKAPDEANKAIAPTEDTLNDEEQKPTEEPNAKKEPITTEVPKSNEESKPQDEDYPIEESMVTETPELIEVPKATEAPKATETPKAIETPKETETPKATDAPKAVEKPKVSDAPKATETPKATVAPKAPKATPTPSPKPSGGTVSKGMTGTPSKKFSDSAIATAKKIINKIITEDMRPVDKVRIAHDYIGKNTVYYDLKTEKTDDYPDYVFTTAGVLEEGKAVCQGYADTFQLFMELLEIECKFVVGEDLISKVGHAWNMVKLDGNWYHVDVTWDDPIPDQKDRVRYNYFLVTDEVMAKDHDWKRSDYPACNSTDYRYYVYEDYIISSINQYEKKFIELYNKGERAITILYPEEGKPDMSFYIKYDFLHTVDGTGTKHMSVNSYTPWRLGDYTVYTVLVK